MVERRSGQPGQPRGATDQRTNGQNGCNHPAHARAIGQNADQCDARKQTNATLPDWQHRQRYRAAQQKQQGREQPTGNASHFRSCHECCKSPTTILATP
ncbi:hypothetical protein [Methyloversatilis sp.]|uniref:hypothetical protein n=1 Tax=Methyloversatilis sp. TaxID=2569862 RepID=UPI0027347639|nr:hypothetical protein [Methyloversatilis sp.]MDP2870406.1 hypothetical protein [Methyloversatilis sp.]MDP3457123.1 hypothetical protein [Methyloversatilis sp.]MDP3576790.1 hypothetical protein [Methyloversatilis sp.]